jgi:hypothetical protein
MFALHGNGTGNAGNFSADEEVLVAPSANTFMNFNLSWISGQIIC